jgi:hypothetical protein
VEGVKQGAKKYLQDELKRVQEGLRNFKLSTNIYQQGIYKEKENDVNQMLEKLENYSFQNNTTQQQNKSGFRPEIVIPLVLLAVVVVAGVIMIVRNKKQAKVKAK